MRIVITDATVTIGPVAVFHHLFATFPSGDVSALVGPSGSGKSTLLSAMAGHKALAGGRIEIGAEKVSRATSRLVAWVPQGSNTLGSRTALDNVAIGALSAGRSLTDALRRARSELSRVGLAEKAGTPTNLLSGGELQRIGFARALSSDRPLIFADEPSASLDVENTYRLANLLAQLSSHSTIVIATHDPILMASASHVVDMRTAAR